MASLASVGDSVTLSVKNRGETVLLSISGTYNMTLVFQREVGAPGSGAWVTLKTYTTPNATVAFRYVTESYNENLRLLVTVDTSGTAVATLEDETVLGSSRTVRDATGRVIQEFTEGGPVDQTVDLSVATVTITPRDHGGRVMLLNRAAGVTATLPAATGSRVKYRFFAQTTVTSNGYIIQVANASDTIRGVLGVTTDAAGVNIPAAATSDTITMNGSTTGGVIGSYVELEDIATNLWRVSGALVSTGVEATPFSAAV